MFTKDNNNKKYALFKLGMIKLWLIPHNLS